MLSTHALRDAGIAATSNDARRVFMFTPEGPAWRAVASVKSNAIVLARNGATITVDQRLTKDISFFGTGFYSNRRAHFVNPSNLSPAQTHDMTVMVPTWNPYYPTGSAPSVVMRSLISAVATPLAISPCNRAMMSFGTAAGANNPNHALAS
mgnify:CR=1 FL=1